MDSGAPHVVEAGPPRAQGLALLGLALVLVVVAVRTDLVGATLVVPGTGVAFGLAVRDLLLVPVLRADASGLELRNGLRRRTVLWDDVVRLSVVKDRRALLLEVELVDDEVLLLSRGRLGRDPRDVLEDLRAVRTGD